MSFKTPSIEARLNKTLATKGVMSAPELLRILKSRTEIKRKTEAGLMISLGSGFYASPGLDPFSARVIAASRYYPKTVISNLTALVVHGLSDESLDQVDVDIEKNTSLRNRMLRVHRVTKGALVGKLNLDFQGYKIRVYDVERSLCEAYKSDPQGPVFYKALKRYIKTHSPQPQRIALYDRTLGTEVLPRLQQELANA